MDSIQSTFILVKIRLMGEGAGDILKLHEILKNNPTLAEVMADTITVRWMTV